MLSTLSASLLRGEYHSRDIVPGIKLYGLFHQGAAGALGFLAQTVDGDTKLTVTGGTIALNSLGYLNPETLAYEQKQGVSFAYIGTKLITVDPRITWMAAHSEYHIQVRPGTDAAVAMAMLHVMIEEDLTC